MDIRITNESTGSEHALVRVYDVPLDGGNILPRQDKQAGGELACGESLVVSINPNRFFMLLPAPIIGGPVVP